MKPSDIELKLSRLQDRLEQYRGREDVAAGLEDLYWREVDRLRTLGCYDRLPCYVSWLAEYRSPSREQRLFK